jgi:DedD protein
MADEGFHEIQLSGKHLVALFMAGTVVAVVIFLCGVMVGRGIHAQRAALAEAAANETPADPTAGVQALELSEPTPTATQGTSAASQETLSYPDRLASSTPPAETLKPAPKPPAPERVPVPPPRERPAETTPTPAVANEPAGSGFAVQVAAVRERDEADSIAKRLAGKGYPAYVMAPASGTPRVFRVRVGKFRERRDAERTAGRLEREEQFKPWITR